ncbi:hypothetical protein A2W32_03065 [candidate division WWE3 bacterium RBG_16_37_10]|uniref:Uncharacterized protein n=1 Tax=candidate division WWE3 bacterium RBG_16_37_10 TaxID=1802610 RepID=A0A1F4UWM7_UNCKA|nr:MAG: hypothetical protein A2W32_03065 [candidate division WWE3 bacterium RBG_16_37_10]
MRLLKRSFTKKEKKLVVVLSILLVLILSLYTFLIDPVIKIYQHANKIPAKITFVENAVKSQDFRFLPFEIEYLKEDFVEIDKAATRLSVFKPVPFLGSYISDVKVFSSVAVDMIDTAYGMLLYMDDVIPNLSFSGWSDNTGSQAATINELSTFLTDYLPLYRDRINTIKERMISVDTSKYPESVKGIEVRASLEQIKELTISFTNSFDVLGDLVADFPSLVGTSVPKNYLFLLSYGKDPQVEKFVAYAVFRVNGTNVSIVRTGDVGVLGPQLTKYIKPGTELKAVWEKALSDVGLEGIVVVNDEVIKSVVGVLGKVNANELGDITADNVQANLLKFYESAGKKDLQSKKEKSVVGTLLFNLVKEAVSTGSLHKKAELIKVLLNEKNNGNISFYFANEKLQNLVEFKNFGI